MCSIQVLPYLQQCIFVSLSLDKCTWCMSRFGQKCLNGLNVNGAYEQQCHKTTKYAIPSPQSPHSIARGVKHTSVLGCEILIHQYFAEPSTGLTITIITFWFECVTRSKEASHLLGISISLINLYFQLINGITLRWRWAILVVQPHIVLACAQRHQHTRFLT